MFVQISAVLALIANRFPAQMIEEWVEITSSSFVLF